MKKLIFAFTAAAGFAATPAFAGDLEAHCEAYAAENGIEPAGCPCLAEKAAEVGVTDELLAVESEADSEGISAAAQAVVDACFPAA